MSGKEFAARLQHIANQITLAEDFSVLVGFDTERYYFQIRCWRKDVITEKYGYGYGGKAYLSPHATESELVGTVFGLYKSYWEHEARESFLWDGRRIYGPHISVNALWQVAQHVDVRGAQHVEDQP